MPSTYNQDYNTWLADYTQQGQNGHGAPATQRGAGLGAAGFGATDSQRNTYTSGQTNRDYARENLGVGGNSASAANMAHGMLNPVGGIIEGYRGYGHFKDAQKLDRHMKEMYDTGRRNAAARAPTEYLGSIDPTSKTFQQARMRSAGSNDDMMSMGEIQASMHLEDQNRQRAGMEQSIEDYFNDPGRAGWQQQIVRNRLQNDLSNVQQDYTQNLRGSVLNSASRGLRGGSVDVERQGKVAEVRDSSAVGAASQAGSTMADFRGQDQQSRSNLMGLVNSQGIGDSQQLSSALQGIHNTTMQAGQNYSQQQQQRQLTQFNQQQQSQAWGQGLQSFAGAINNNPYRMTNATAWGGYGRQGGF